MIDEYEDIISSYVIPNLHGRRICIFPYGTIGKRFEKIFVNKFNFEVDVYDNMNENCKSLDDIKDFNSIENVIVIASDSELYYSDIREDIKRFQVGMVIDVFDKRIIYSVEEGENCFRNRVDDAVFF